MVFLCSIDPIVPGGRAAKPSFALSAEKRRGLPIRWSRLAKRVDVSRAVTICPSLFRNGGRHCCTEQKEEVKRSEKAFSQKYLGSLGSAI